MNKISCVVMFTAINFQHKSEGIYLMTLEVAKMKLRKLCEIDGFTFHCLTLTKFMNSSVFQ